MTGKKLVPYTATQEWIIPMNPNHLSQVLSEAADLIATDVKKDSRAVKMALQAVNDAQDNITEAKSGIMKAMKAIERVDSFVITFGDDKVGAIKNFEKHYVKTLDNLNTLAADFGKVYQELLTIIPEEG